MRANEDIRHPTDSVQSLSSYQVGSANPKSKLNNSVPIKRRYTPLSSFMTTSNEWFKTMSCDKQAETSVKIKTCDVSMAAIQGHNRLTND